MIVLQALGLLVAVIAANIILIVGFSQLELDHGINVCGGYLLSTIIIETIMIMLLIGGMK